MRCLRDEMEVERESIEERPGEREGKEGFLGGGFLGEGFGGGNLRKLRKLGHLVK